MVAMFLSKFAHSVIKKQSKHGLSVQGRQFLDVLSQSLVRGWANWHLTPNPWVSFKSPLIGSIYLDPVAAKFSFFSLDIITKEFQFWGKSRE